MSRSPRRADQGRPSVVDLFCGAGGFSLGAHLAGFETVLAVDIDTDLTSSFEQNFPEAELLNEDLTAISPEVLSGKLGTGRVAGVIGGPPCQGFSEIGRRTADDPRNALVVRFFEHVAAIKPMFFVMENVPMLGADQHADLLDEALSVLPSTYEILPPTCLNAGDFGAATARPRLLVVGYDPSCVNQLSSEDLAPRRRTPNPTVGDAIADVPEPTAGYDFEAMPYRDEPPSPYAAALRKCPPRGLGDSAARAMQRRGVVTGNARTEHSAAVRRRFDALLPGQRDRVSRYPRLRWDRPAPVLRAGTGKDRGSYQAARPIHPAEPRVISVREAARLQGFPDWFVFSDTKWHSHRMIGNSVSPVFATAVLRLIRSRLDP